MYSDQLVPWYPTFFSCFVFIEVPNSPRLGPNSEIYGQVIINQNDDASGVLELSNATINIPESQIGNFINIVRTRGAFGEVCSTKLQLNHK